VTRIDAPFPDATGLDALRTPAPDLLTPRLRLRAAAPELATAAAAFFVRNRAAHGRWNPPPDDTLFTAAGQVVLLDTAARAMAAGSLASWWLFDRDAPATHDASPALGRVQLTQIARGPFCSAMLGYAIDTEREGRGLMREALQAVLDDAFGRLGLHRVQANVRPENTRSLGLLARLGFEREGLAREYLFIDGAWRDHVMTALRHPHWRADQPPPHPA
jgi:[ribosomal protein S5]-alanine N-acetyltransferase